MFSADFFHEGFFLKDKKNFVSPCSVSLQTSVADPDPHPDPDPYVWDLPDKDPTSTDPAPDPYIAKQK
jgi:hypothetical protein